MLRQCLSPFLQGSARGLSYSRGLAGDSFQQNEGLQVALMWDEAMPAFPASLGQRVGKET